MPTLKLLKPVENWTSVDFFRYYQKKIQATYGIEFTIEDEAIKAFAARIKGFVQEMGLSPQEYKNFIDEVFEGFFSREGYVPAFGAIVSKKVYYLVKKSENLEKVDWESLQKEVLQLFKSIGREK